MFSEAMLFQDVAEGSAFAGSGILPVVSNARVTVQACSMAGERPLMMSLKMIDSLVRMSTSASLSADPEICRCPLSDWS